MNGNWLMWVLGTMLMAIVGSYGWATYITARVEDKVILRIDRFEDSVERQLDRIYRGLPEKH